MCLGLARSLVVGGSVRAFDEPQYLGRKVPGLGFPPCQAKEAGGVDRRIIAPRPSKDLRVSPGGASRELGLDFSRSQGLILGDSSRQCRNIFLVDGAEPVFLKPASGLCCRAGPGQGQNRAVLQPGVTGMLFERAFSEVDRQQHLASALGVADQLTPICERPFGSSCSGHRPSNRGARPA